MKSYIGKRLLQAVIVLLGATLLIYALVFAMPGDPALAIVGEKNQHNQALINQVRAQYNLDKPFILQYLLFMKGVFTLNFGNAMQFGHQPVINLIGQAFPATICLALLAFAFELVIGIVVGVVAGIKRGGIFDQTVLILTLVLIAVPTFVTGFIARLFFGVDWKLLPPTVDNNLDFIHLLMPALILASVSIANIVRLTRNEVSTNLSADYVQTAKAKGLSKIRITFVHVLRNSLIPVVTYLGADLGALMGGAVVTETVFNVHGIGNLLYKAIPQGDGPLIVSIVTILVLIFVISNLLVDILYAFLDPRIRYGKGEN
ncbi:MAG: ABC transporter permease [Candidatus Ancillula sp.]|jgi:oligopeptide transport system permease protein|nr:ABC transporter permease [Candidatus Ancillula sp.]